MKLGEWLKKNDVKALDFGRRIGLKQPNSIYRYLQETRKPEPAIVVAIHRETGGEVGFSDFYGEQEDGEHSPSEETSETHQRGEAA